MLEHELREAQRLALDAGKILLDIYATDFDVEYKGKSDPVTEADRKANDYIVNALRAKFPGDGVVAEETADRSDALRAGRCWYVDPLDGTTNFVHALPHCSVSIARHRDGAPDIAVVHDPLKSETFSAVLGGGATLGGEPIAVSATPSLGEALLVTGFPYDRRDHIDFYLEYFKAFILKAVDLRRLGSAALDLCYVAAGRFDGFWEWKLAPWDTAAGRLIAEEAGATVSDFDGGAYDPWSPRILATNGAIHDECLALLRSLPGHPEEG